MTRAGRDLEIPDAGDLTYLLHMFFDAGPAVQTPMGDAPLGWSDIRAYAKLTWTDLEPWEARALHDLSATYLVERQRGEKPLSIPPSRRDDA